MDYPVIRKEMDMTDIRKFRKDELVGIITNALSQGDSILADIIDSKTLETRKEAPKETMQSIISRAFSKIESECESYEDRIRGYGYWDHRFEDVQEEVGDAIEDNVRKVVEKAIRSGCTEPVSRFIEDVKVLMERHDDDYYFFWITEDMDDFFDEMEKALERGVIPK